MNLQKIDFNFLLYPIMSLSDRCIRVIIRGIDLTKINKNPDSINDDKIPLHIRIAILNLLRRVVRTIENFLIQSYISPGIKLKSGKNHGILKIGDYYITMWFGKQHGLCISASPGRVMTSISNGIRSEVWGYHYSFGALYYNDNTTNASIPQIEHNRSDLEKQIIVLRNDPHPGSPNLARTTLQEFSLCVYLKYIKN
jgi:hypothetical protein